MRTILFMLVLLLSACLGVQAPFMLFGDDAPPPPDVAITAVPDDSDSALATIQQAVTVESAEVSGYAGNLALHVTGTLPDGCEFPVNADISVDGNTVLVNVFRVMPPESVCPQVVAPFSASFALPASIEPGPVFIHVNDITIKALIPSIDGPAQVEPLEPPTLDTPGGVVRSVPIVTDVQIVVLESYPMRLSLTVTGEFRNGCELPLQVEQERAGNTVTVSLYRVIAADTVCPDVLTPFTHSFMLDGGFESGSYTITVNGFTTEIEL